MRFLWFCIIFSLLSVFSFSKADSEVNKGQMKNMNSHAGFRTGRASLIAFEPFGKEVHVGLDMLLPFIKVPTKRGLNDNGQEKPLLTFNSAAVTIAGLISGLGLFVGHLLKSITTLRGRENDDESHQLKEEESHSAEHRLDFGVEGTRFSRSLEPLKLVYRNSSGDRVATSFADLLNTVEREFLNENVDLSACLRKSLCYYFNRVSFNVDNGIASGVERMLDGLSQFNWLMGLVHETAIEEAILAGKSKQKMQCELKYSTCKWADPEREVFNLISKRVKFV